MSEGGSPIRDGRADVVIGLSVLRRQARNSRNRRSGSPSWFHGKVPPQTCSELLWDLDSRDPPQPSPMQILHSFHSLLSNWVDCPRPAVGGCLGLVVVFSSCSKLNTNY